MAAETPSVRIGFMLNELSNHVADVVAAVAPSVVQVHGRRRPASGLIYADGLILTTVRAIGGEDGIRVKRHDDVDVEAELAGWDAATNLALVRVSGVNAPPLRPASSPARVGNLAIAVARSWSNSVTASAGIVSVIGGPLHTGRRRAIDQIIRTTAPMHDGFSGGAFIDSTGALIGVTTAAAIRGLGVVIPAGIAWATAARLAQHGHARRGYLGVLGQPVALSASQSAAAGRDKAMLVVGVAHGSAAAHGGVLVGDILLAFEGTPTSSPEDLLDLLADAQAGRQATLHVLRGDRPVDVQVTVGERPGR
jgi:S1-C subfamily serine protease